jgi:hypothetical protein
VIIPVFKAVLVIWNQLLTWNIESVTCSKLALFGIADAMWSASGHHVTEGMFTFHHNVVDSLS